MKFLFYISMFLLVFIASCGSNETSTPTATSEAKSEATVNTDNKLVFQPEIGKTYEYIMVMDMDMKSDVMPVSSTMEMEMTMKANSRDEKGNSELEAVYDRMKMDMDMGTKISWDSEEESNDAMSKTFGDMLGGMLHKPVNMTISKNAQIVTAPDFSEMTESNPMMKEQVDKMGQSFQNMFAIYPDEDIKVGLSWDRKFEKDANGMEMTCKYTIREISSETVYIGMSGDITMSQAGVSGKGTFVGTLNIERSSGMVDGMEMNQDLVLSTQGMKMNMISTTKMNLK